MVRPLLRIHSQAGWLNFKAESSFIFAKRFGVKVFEQKTNTRLIGGHFLRLYHRLIERAAFRKVMKGRHSREGLSRSKGGHWQRAAQLVSGSLIPYFLQTVLPSLGGALVAVYLVFYLGHNVPFLPGIRVSRGVELRLLALAFVFNASYAFAVALAVFQSVGPRQFFLASMSTVLLVAQYDTLLNHRSATH